MMDNTQKSGPSLPMTSPKSPMEFHSARFASSVTMDMRRVGAGVSIASASFSGGSSTNSHYPRWGRKSKHASHFPHCQTPKVEYYPSRRSSSGSSSSSSSSSTASSSAEAQTRAQTRGSEFDNRDAQHPPQHACNEPSAFSRLVANPQRYSNPTWSPLVPPSTTTKLESIPSSSMFPTVSASESTLHSTSSTSVSNPMSLASATSQVPQHSNLVHSSSIPKMSWSSFEEMVGVAEHIVYREETNNDWVALPTTTSDVYVDFHGRIYHRPHL